MDSHVYPAESVYRGAAPRARRGGSREPRSAGHRGPEGRGAQPRAVEPLPAVESGLSNVDYAHLAEITGRSPHLAPEAINCAAPDTGNMEVLHLFGTAEQKERWLQPLLDGEIRSAFAMTEPAVASSDATNISTEIRRDGDDYVINGRKWWISGSADPRCAVMIVMGKTNPDASRHAAAVDDPRADGHSGRHRGSAAAGVRLLGPARPLRDHLRRRPRAGVEPHLLGRCRLRDRAGTARARPDPPLHARRRAWPSERSS